MLTRHPDGNGVYTADMHRSYLTLEQVRLQHGPVRPIVSITDADRRALFNLLAAAKRKAIYSVAVAVYRTWIALRDDHGGMARAPVDGDI
jgi:hypothetical protein